MVFVHYIAAELNEIKQIFVYFLTLNMLIFWKKLANLSQLILTLLKSSEKDWRETRRKADRDRLLCTGCKNRQRSRHDSSVKRTFGKLEWKTLSVLLFWCILSRRALTSFYLFWILMLKCEIKSHKILKTREIVACQTEQIRKDKSAKLKLQRIKQKWIKEVLIFVICD